MIVAITLLTVLLTSILSGVVGMAGGIILMALLVSITSVSHAMILHGVVQAVANGSRFLMLRSHMQWAVLPGYLIGATVAIGPVVLLAVVPDKNLLLILLGVMPLLSHVLPRRVQFDIRTTGVSILCGFTVVLAPLLTGTSGPLLDIFYQKSPLNRFEIVASKAFTQTLGHIVKACYYSYVAYFIRDNPLPSMLVWTLCAAIVLAVLGTLIGTRLLHKLREESFQRYVTWIIDAVGVVCIVRGVVGLFQ